jgi:serine/threonine protein kinase
MSLENLLVHNESGALIIDMGMCLRIPFLDDATPAASQGQPYPQLTASMQNMSVANGGHPTQAPYAIPSTSAPAISASAPNCNSLPLVRNGRVRPRSLILPQGTCGKWIYMSPEICRDKEPFDGFAVDVWASGVILFLMLTGFPPWDRASPTDERFKYMTAGYLVQMLTEWNLGLSPDALDLLQRMLFLDPKDRLSLDQVRAHPWMVNGPLAPPTNLPGF